MISLQRVFVVVVAASLIAIAESLLIAQVAASDAARSKPINAQTFCGVWQGLPTSGGFHHLNVIAAKSKGESLYQNGDAVRNALSEASPRTAVVVETISHQEGESVHVRDRFTTKATRRLVSVTRQNVMMFAAQRGPNSEIWTPRARASSML